MPYLLRTIRKPRWYKQTLPWLGQDEIPADPLADLPSTDNSLSVWSIEDDRSNLNQVLAAVAANRSHLVHLDYAIIKDDFLAQLKREQTPGKSPDDSVNDSWHFDFKELSAQKVVELAKIIFNNGERIRVLPKQVEELIRKAVQEGKISEKRLSDDIKKKLLK